MRTYEHRQFSPWPLAATAAIALATRVGRRGRRGRALRLGTIFFLGQFCMLTTAVDEERIAWAFGLGFPGGSIDADAIAEAEAVQAPWWDLFGIHWSPGAGWVWNLAGRDAVRIRKKNGSVITLGTDDPAGLLDAILAAKEPA